MTDWNTAFLGAIAVAVVVMAIIQIGAIVFLAQLARRVDRLTQKVEQEIAPLLVSLADVGQSASRAASLAVAQVERFDRLFADLANRLEDTMAVVQSAVVAPAREGLAVMAALRAALTTLRGVWGPRARRPGVDEEDALFIG